LGRAVSPTNVIAFDMESASCPGSAAVVVSGDRGRTWRAGDCVAVAGADPSAGAGSVVVRTGAGAPARVGADGRVVSLASPPGGTVVAAATTSEGDGLYALVLPPGAFDPGTGMFVTPGPALVRGRDPGGWTACAPLPFGRDFSFRIHVSGPWVVVEHRPAGQAEAALVSSSDGCASWRVHGSSTERLDGVMSDGALISGELGFTTRISRDGGRSWAPLGDVGLAISGFHVPDPANPGSYVVLDEFSPVGLPLAWPASPFDAATPPVPASARQAMAIINERYRRPLGMPDIRWEPRLAAAAVAHSNYWSRNGGWPKGNALQFHGQTPGRPGFTGVSPGDRCDAAGYGGGCGEVGSSDSNPAGAVRSWLGTPYHGAPFFTSVELGLGSSRSASTGNLAGDSLATPGLRVRPGAVNTRDAALRIWPFDGARDVPVTWTGGEVPDPLEHYTGDRADVGPVLFVGSSGPATITLKGPGGAIPLINPGAKGRAVPSVSFEGGWKAVFAGRRLLSRTAYTLEVTSAGATHRTTFTTAVVPARSQPRAISYRGRFGGPTTILVPRALAPRGAVLTIRRREWRCAQPRWRSCRPVAKASTSRRRLVSATTAVRVPAPWAAAPQRFTRVELSVPGFTRAGTPYKPWREVVHLPACGTCFPPARVIRSLR
jgi:hypothetical protein